MKTVILRLIKCAWLVALIFVAFNANATTLYWRGKGASVSAGTGTTFNGANWSSSASGSPTTAPTSADDLMMNLGTSASASTISITTITVSSLTITLSGIANNTPTLIITGNNSLTVTNAVSINDTRTITSVNNIFIFSDSYTTGAVPTVTFGSLSVISNGSYAYIRFSFKGNFIVNGATTATITAGTSSYIQFWKTVANGVYTFNGSVTADSRTSNSGNDVFFYIYGGTMNFNGNVDFGATAIGGAVSFAGTSSLASTVVFNGDVLFGPGTKFNAQSSYIKSVILDKVGTQALTINSPNIGFGNFTVGSSNTPTVNVNSGTGNNPFIQSAITGNNTVTVATGAALNLGTVSLNRDVNTGTGAFMLNGTLELAGANNFPGNYSAYALAPASTVLYDGTVTQTVAGVNYGNLTMTNGGTTPKKTLAGTSSVLGNLLISSGSNLDVSTFQLTGTSGNTFTNNGYLYVGGVSNYPVSFGTNTMAAASTVEYNSTTLGQIAAVVASPGYGNLVFTDGIANSVSKALAGNITMQSDLTVNGTANVDVAANTITRTAAGGTFTIADGGVFQTAGTTSTTDFPQNFTTFNPNTTGDYRYVASGAQPIQAKAYGQLTMLGGTSGAPKTFLGNATANSTVTMNTGSFVDLGGNTLNSASGTPAFTQNGYLKVAAAFPSTFVLGSGTSSTVEYYGSVAQVLSAQIYNNLVFNNSSGTLTATAASTIGVASGTNVATFTAGVLNNRSLGTAGALAFIAGASTASASTTSYVSGYVAKTGATAFTYPVGDVGTTAGTAFHTLAITAPTVSTTPTVSYVSSSPSSTIGTALNIIHTIDPSAYWTLANTGSTTATATVTILTRDETAVFMPGAQVFVAGYNTAMGYWEQLGDLGTPASGDQQSLVTNAPVVLSNYSAFTVGSTTYLLPVSLTSFTGTASGCTAALAWATSLESNSSYYAVEASSDASSFMQVAKVASKNSPTGATYSYACALGSGTGYFRLKAVDNDGKFTYSSIVSVTGTGACGTALSVKVSPNPTKNMLTIQGLDGGKNRLALYDMNGKKMAEVLATGTSQRMNISGYAMGVYVLRIENAGGNVGNVKVVKD